MRPARLFAASVARIVVLAAAVGASVTLPVLTRSVAAPRPAARKRTVHGKPAGAIRRQPLRVPEQVDRVLG